MAARRSYGTGRIIVRIDANGRETFYGAWWANGRRVKRRLGLKRQAGTHDGLTAAMAEAELRRRMLEDQPSRRVAERVTVAEVGRRYVAEAHRKGRKESTCANVESEVRVHLAPFFGEKGIEAITHVDVADLVRVLERKKLAPKSIRNVVATLSALFNFATLPRHGWAATNPCRGVVLPGVAEPQTQVRFLTLEQLDALIANVPAGLFHEIDRALILTAAMTGLRKGELVALRWRDVDWPAQRIRVERNYTRGEYTSPKSRRSRSVPMTDEVAGVLDRLFKASSWQGDEDLVFAHPATGGVLPKSNVSRRMRVALKAAGLDVSHRFHDLRHTFATQLASKGVPMRSLQELMGHADFKTTLIYAGYAPAEREAEMIARAFVRGSVRGSNLSEPEVISEHARAADMAVSA